MRLMQCKIQTLLYIFSFFLGCILTIIITSLNKNQNLENVYSQYEEYAKPQSGDYDLVIFILSAPHNGDRRAVIRETWLKWLNNIQYDDELENFKVKYYFLIGSIQLTPDTILHLSNEQSLHSDLLFLNVKDGYSLLTLKVLRSFVWLNKQVNKNNFVFKYLLKCDDDTFIRIDDLSKEIVKVYNEQFNSNLKKNVYKHLYWGYFNGNARIKRNGKWKEENWILCDNYLPYALGGGYILSNGLIAFIANNSEHLSLYNAEDVSLGVWLAPVNGIYRKHDVRFDTEWTSRGCKNSFLVTHKHTTEEMKKMYKNILTSKKLCLNENTKRYTYEYNWNVLPSKCCNRDENIV